MLGFRVTDIGISGKYAWSPSVKMVFQLPMSQDALQLAGAWGLGLRPGERVDSTTIVRRSCLKKVRHQT